MTLKKSPNDATHQRERERERERESLNAKIERVLTIPIYHLSRELFLFKNSLLQKFKIYSIIDQEAQVS